ncbi:MAG TPA: polysaccharide deacetylase family protein [Dongiaceae bacterium]|nr:polysaccharide deacetylase family protein [Dongiaceae bacterium]
MTITAELFSQQVRFLQESGYHVITLADLVSSLAGKKGALPGKSVVITADDGNESVFTEMYPIIKANQLHVTLFIYPSAISNASYALTWDQLRAMQASGLVEVQSHSYWHPNFHTEKARLAPDAYRKFVADQLERSKRVIAQAMGRPVDILAWPFGIYDQDLIGAASSAGYTAAVTIERRPVTSKDSLMTLPRYIVTQQDTGTAFAHLLSCMPSTHMSLK